jgi:hypothetical protein
MASDVEPALGNVGDSGGVVILETKEKMLDAPEGRRLIKLFFTGDFGIGDFGLCRYRSE